MILFFPKNFKSLSNKSFLDEIVRIFRRKVLKIFRTMTSHENLHLRSPLDLYIDKEFEMAQLILLDQIKRYIALCKLHENSGKKYSSLNSLEYWNCIL